MVDRTTAVLAVLTPRGAAVAVAGLALLGAASVTGGDGLLRVGVLALALPLASLLLAHVARPRLEVARSLVPARVAAGETARVRLAVRSGGGLPSRLLRAEDARDPGLGRPSRFVVERRGGGRTSVTYALRPTRRGRYRVGPLTATAVDPLGLVRGVPATTRGAGSAPSSTSLLVLPVVEALPPLPPGTAWAGSGERSNRSVTTTGEHSAGAREYRPGDHVRRVHWRATARVGRLMVRQEEDPLQQQSVVLLDTSASAWGAASAFEAAVSAAASVVSLLGAGGTPVELVLRSSALVGTTEELLDALAVVALEDDRAEEDRGEDDGAEDDRAEDDDTGSGDDDAGTGVTGSGHGSGGGHGAGGGLRDGARDADRGSHDRTPPASAALPFSALTGLGRSGTPASVVAVLGDLRASGPAGHGPGLLPLLLPLPHRGVRASALLVAGAGTRTAADRRRGGERGGAHVAPTGGASSLRAAGWVVAEVADGEPLATAWSALLAEPVSRAG